MKKTVHGVTKRHLRRRDFRARDLARLCECTEIHADALLTGAVEPSAREHAVMRLVANVRLDRLAAILDTLESGYEWKRIPGFDKYEASAAGLIRRAGGGHGSMPGHVLRMRTISTGHLYVNIAPNEGRIRSMPVHRAICLAFHGEPPTPSHIVCHRNDQPSDNRPDNLYWGTHQDNANDRQRNHNRRVFGTKLTHDDQTPVEPTIRQMQKYQKKTMISRLARQAARAR